MHQACAWGVHWENIGVVQKERVCQQQLQQDAAMWRVQKVQWQLMPMRRWRSAWWTGRKFDDGRPGIFFMYDHFRHQDTAQVSVWAVPDTSAVFCCRGGSPAAPCTLESHNPSHWLQLEAAPIGRCHASLSLPCSGTSFPYPEPHMLQQMWWQLPTERRA
eukprot:1142058-Pelagomonas_calceolata.AAC.2